MLFAYVSLESIQTNVRQLAPKTIRPGRFAPSLWTIRPKSLDDSPQIFGRLAPKLWREELLMRGIYETSSNHRLERAGLKALEALLFKMLGIEKMVMRALFWKRDWKFAFSAWRISHVKQRQSIDEPVLTASRYSDCDTPVKQVRWVYGRFAYESFRLLSVRLLLESIRLRH